MYHKQVNPAAIRSQILISDALICLMRQKHFSRITVTEICREADIGRKTFYRHFELKEDVIDFQLDVLLFRKGVRLLCENGAGSIYLTIPKSELVYYRVLKEKVCIFAPP